MSLNVAMVLDPNGCYIQYLIKEKVNPRGIATVGDLIYFADSVSRLCFVYHPSGKLVASFGCVESPYGLCVDTSGFIYVCSFQKFGEVIVF